MNRGGTFFQRSNGCQKHWSLFTSLEVSFLFVVPRC
jgi:hypothetical protein